MKKRRKQSTQATQSSLRLVLCSLPRERESELIAVHGTRLPRHPKIKEITNSTRNITNKSFAMPADAAAIPPNPKTAATSAMIRNTTAQPNISSPPQRLNRICRLPRASLHGVNNDALPLPLRLNLNRLPEDRSRGRGRLPHGKAIFGRPTGRGYRDWVQTRRGTVGCDLRRNLFFQ